MTRVTQSLLLLHLLNPNTSQIVSKSYHHMHAQDLHTTMASRLFTLFMITAVLLIIGSASAYKYHDPEYDPDEPPRRPREQEREYDPEVRPRRPREREQEREYDPERPREREREYDPDLRPRRQSDSPFLLQESKQVVRTDAGQMRVVRGFGVGLGGVDRPLHIGFITMEPKSLFVPQYMDSSLIIFIRRGVAKIGLIYKDEFVERDLKVGDVYRVPAGSAFYMANHGEGQRLHIVCSIDPSESLGIGPFQSFYIGGGKYPASVLRGFDPHTLATAFNVTVGELDELMSSQTEGPIVYITDPQSHAPSMWNNFVELKRQGKLRYLKKLAESHGMTDLKDVSEVRDDKWTWSLSKLMKSVFGTDMNGLSFNKRKGGGPDSYNLYDRNPDFKNNYGWSVALEEHDYSFLENSGVSIYLVNLTAGSMMAPHINPTATEYGIVLQGSGSLQIVYPNGTSAINTEIKEGDVFLVPRYFPFCQIASRTGPLEFFGFTTSSRRNRPQFLVGASSILHTLPSPELAAAFGVGKDRFDSVIGAQKESVILPTAEVAPGDVESH